MGTKLVVVVFAVLVSACSLHDDSSHYRVRGERAARSVCNGSQSRSDVHLARDYLAHVMQHANRGTLDHYLSQETLVTCGWQGEEGSVRTAVRRIVFRHGTDEQIADLIRALPSPRDFCSMRWRGYDEDLSQRIHSVCRQIEATLPQRPQWSAPPSARRPIQPLATLGAELRLERIGIG